jgi:hypothetical protein
MTTVYTSSSTDPEDSDDVLLKSTDVTQTVNHVTE